MTQIDQNSDVAVIIVNYGTAALSVAAAESVLAHRHDGRRVSVHLVDNASPGDDAEVLSRAHRERGWGERVTLFLETENHGFGRGNNVVLKALAALADPPGKVFLLNPDAQLENEAVALLADALDADSKAAAAGASILDETGRLVAGAARFPTTMGEVLRIVNFGPIDRVLGHKRDSLTARFDGGPVDWVSGAAVMFRLEALREVGFFDPNFFLYYEEVELMLRLSRGGWHTLFVPEARVSHIAGAATGRGHDRRKREPAYLYDSWGYYFLVAKGRIGALGLALAVIPAAWFNILMRRLRGQRPDVPRRFVGDHLRLVVWPLLRPGRAR